MFFRQVFCACLLWLAVATSADARAIVIAHPADVADVQQILRLTKMDQAMLSRIRRDIETTNRQDPANFVDMDIYMQPFTVDAINEHVAKSLAPYIAYDYAQKLLKDLGKSPAKNSIRLEEIERMQGIDAARAEFKRLPPAEQKTINEFRSSAAYLSLINGMTNSKDERTAMFAQWSKEEVQARVSRANKVIEELMDTGLKLEKEEFERNEVALPNRIPRTGVRSFDQESRVSFEYLRANLRQNIEFAEEVKKLDFSNVLAPQNLVTRKGLEEANLTLLAAENIFDNNAKRHETMRNAYNTALENIIMTPSHRQEVIASNNKSMARVVDLRIRRSEYMRNILELEKQILSLCEKRFGKIKLEAKTLMFDSEEDLKQYNGLIKQVTQVNQELLNMEKEDLEYRTRAIEKSKQK